MDNIIDKTQELETKSIRSLLWIYAVPTVVSQVIASVYNIVDRVFLGQNVGAMAIAGLAITLPIMNIVHAFGSLVGAGASARMSIVLGRKDVRWAEKILGNSMLLTFFFGFLFLLAGYLWMNPILEAFGASAQTVSYAREYMVIVLPGMFLTTLTFNLCGLMRSSGYPQKSMWILVGGAVLNIVLDAAFIPGFHWGIRGAAWATTISMALSSVVAVWHFLPKPLFGAHDEETEVHEIAAGPVAHRPSVAATRISADIPAGGNSRVRQQAFIRFKRHAWEPKFYIFRNILAIGISPFSMNVAASAVAALLNSQLIRYGGDLAVGTYGIVNSFSSILFLLMLGICQGMQPIAGYNYGAGHAQRLKETYRETMKVTVLTGIVGSLVACLFPAMIMRCFTQDAAVIDLGIPAMRYLTVMMVFIAFTITNSQFFQSIDMPWIAIATSLSRQVLFLIPMMYVVPALFVGWHLDGLTGVWVSCTICDLLGSVLAGVLLLTHLKVFRPGYKAPERRPRKECGPTQSQP